MGIMQEFEGIEQKVKELKELYEIIHGKEIPDELVEGEIEQALLEHDSEVQ